MTDSLFVGENQNPFIWTAVGRAYDIPASLSGSQLTLANSWLRDCITGSGKHEICGNTGDPPLLPTRVVDVGSSDADVCLHISHAGEKSNYVALSHCWSGKVPIMTTASTIQDFMRRLPSETPRTFADAIAVTRNMGQKYLWIDSLCILQDSADDWIAESSHMDQVYSQALFTIVADAAENSSSGFLKPQARNVRKASAITCDLSSLTERSASPITVHVRERGDLAFQLPYHDFYPGGPWGGDPFRSNFDIKERLIRSKLSTRAWAFQERLLSPRTLHFGPTEMAWECRALCKCECSATNERTSRITSLLKGSIALQPVPISSGDSAQSVLRSIDYAWQRDIVEEYTRLDVTKETDHLFALAGLAMRASTLRLGDQYLAGMWRKTIREGLSWYTTPERASHRSASGNALPTWSWASVSGQIKHARIADVPSDASLMDVFEVQYTADEKAPMGAGPSTPAWLLGSGYLVPIDSVWFQPYSSDEGSDSAIIYRSCYRVKWPSNVALPENCVAMMDIHESDPLVDKSILLDRLDGLELDTMDLVMLLTALSKGVVLGLVLNRRSTKGTVPEYERVGFVNGMDSIGEFVSWSSSSYSVRPMFSDDWGPDNDEGISAILESAGISKSTMKIW